MRAMTPALWLILIAALTCPALAQPKNAAQQAKAAYTKGVTYFQSQRYSKALQEFETAYKLDPVPVLLYNLARTHEEMGRAKAAVEHFQLYLTRVPNAEDRVDVERRIRVMQAILNQQKTAQTPESKPAVVVITPPVSNPIESKPPHPTKTASAVVTPSGPNLAPWAYTTLALGTAAIAGGVVLGLKSRTHQDAHQDATTPADKSATAADAKSTANWANIAYAGGGILLAGGITLWVLDTEKNDSSAMIVPTHGGAVFGWRGAF